MRKIELCLITAILVALSLVVCGCEKPRNRVILRPPGGQIAERFGADRAGTVNFHIARLSMAIDKEHEKVVELAGRIRELEEGIDPNELSLLAGRIAELEGKAIVDGDRVDLYAEYGDPSCKFAPVTIFDLPNTLITKTDPNEKK